MVFQNLMILVLTLMMVLSATTTSSPTFDDTDVMLTHSMIKVRPAGPRVQTGSIIDSIYSAKNEVESFQVVIVAGAANVEVTSIDILPHDMISQGIAVSVFRQHMINITTVSSCNGALGLWPDPLIPAKDDFYGEKRNAFPWTVEIGQQQAWWVDVFVPSDASTGSFQLDVTVNTASQPPVSKSIMVHVWDFVLPSTSNRYTTTFNCESENILDGKYLNKRPPNISVAEAVELQQLYTILGLRHKTTFSDFLASDLDSLKQIPPNWDTVEQNWGPFLHGMNLISGYQNISVTSVQMPAVFFGQHAQANVSHTEIDELWHGTGCASATPEWGYAFWGSQPDLGASDMLVYCEHALACKTPGCDKWAIDCGVVPSKECTLQHPKLPPLNNTPAIEFWKSAAAHARSEGWFDRMFDYTCDEPGTNEDRIAACKLHGSALHEADPSLQSLITAEYETAQQANMTAAIDIWVPIINYIDSGGKDGICPWYPSWIGSDMMNQRTLYEPLVEKGKKLWWYQSCMSQGCKSSPSNGCPGSQVTCTNGTWPSYMIDSAPTFNRIMSWASYLYNIQGELYWGTNAADGLYTDPNETSWDNQYLAGGNGDGSLTYPGRVDKVGGTHFIPIASIRLKHIRDGLEDIEYMYALEELSSRNETLKEIASVIRRAYDFEHDPSFLLNARKMLGTLISSHSRKSRF